MERNVPSSPPTDASQARIPVQGNGEFYQNGLSLPPFADPFYAFSRQQAPNQQPNTLNQGQAFPYLPPQGHSGSFQAQLQSQQQLPQQYYQQPSLYHQQQNIMQQRYQQQFHRPAAVAPISQHHYQNNPGNFTGVAAHPNTAIQGKSAEEISAMTTLSALSSHTPSSASATPSPTEKGAPTSTSKRSHKKGRRRTGSDEDGEENDEDDDEDNGEHEHSRAKKPRREEEDDTDYTPKVKKGGKVGGGMQASATASSAPAATAIPREKRPHAPTKKAPPVTALSKSSGSLPGTVKLKNSQAFGEGVTVWDPVRGAWLQR